MCSPCSYPEKCWLQFLILRIVCENPSHGYELIKGLKDLASINVKSGSIYTTLRRMEECGVLKSEWKGNDSGPDSREYNITRKGEKVLKKWIEMFMEREKLIKDMRSFYNKKFGGKKK